MTPGNYSIHFMEWVEKTRPIQPPRVANNLSKICEGLRDSQHFLLPDGGELLEKRNLSLFGEFSIRPPYPYVAVEFPVMGDAEGGYEKASRRIILVEDIAIAGHVRVIPLAYHDAVREWHADVHIELPYLDWFDPSTNSLKLTGIEHLFLDSPREQLQRILWDHTLELYAYFGMCAALQCSNVATEETEVSPKLNKRRVSRGRQPFFTYKTLTLGDERARGTSYCATDRTIRSHLRRGHIRRFNSNRMTWVRPAVVHGRSEGFVHKEYALC